MLSKSSPLIFVYGTLRQNFLNQNQTLLPNCANLIDYGFFNAQLFDLGNYPGAILTRSKSSRVHGEVWTLGDNFSSLPVLDNYEELNTYTKIYGPEYRRIMQKITTKKFGKVQAWVYIIRKLRHPCKPILSGDYITYLQQSQTSKTRIKQYCL